MQKKDKKQHIEEQLAKLESIVSKFEKGNISIEEGIAQYKDAAELIKNIKKELTSLELKIKQIKSTYDDDAV